MAQATTDTLKKKAILVRLTRKKMARTKTDKDLTGKVTVDTGAESGALRVQKELFAKESVNGFSRIMNDASTYFYGTTLPWEDRGWRVLPIDLYEEFTQKMNEFTGNFQTEVDSFIKRTTDILSESRKRLGAAFDKSDYSFVSDTGDIDSDFMRNQFKLAVEFRPFEAGDDLRVALSEDEKKKLAEQINRDVEARFADSQKDVARRLKDVIEAIHERLSEPEKVFRDSLIKNLVDLAGIIPALNISGDSRIDKFAKVALDKLASHEPETLRKAPDVREQVAKNAKEILDDMDGIF